MGLWGAQEEPGPQCHPGLLPATASLRLRTSGSGWQTPSSPVSSLRGSALGPGLLWGLRTLPPRQLLICLPRPPSGTPTGSRTPPPAEGRAAGRGSRASPGLQRNKDRLLAAGRLAVPWCSTLGTGEGFTPSPPAILGLGGRSAAPGPGYALYWIDCPLPPVGCPWRREAPPGGSWPLHSPWGWGGVGRVVPAPRL